MPTNYKHQYEQMKKMVAMYQDEVVPGLWARIEKLESKLKYTGGRRKEACEHGRWTYGKSLQKIVCSQCGSPRPYFKNKRGYFTVCDSAYCPNCGAIMDLPRITDQTQAALEKMGRVTHGEEHHG